MAAFVISKAKQQIKAGKVFSCGSQIKTFCKGCAGKLPPLLPSAS